MSHNKLFTILNNRPSIGVELISRQDDSLFNLKLLLERHGLDKTKFINNQF